MKPVLALFPIIIVSFLITENLNAGQSSRPQIVSPEQIQKVMVRIAPLAERSNQQRYSGYILFVDERGQSCAVRGGEDFYIWMGKDSKPNPVKRSLYGYYRKIRVAPGNFKYLRIHKTEKVWGIPLKPFRVYWKESLEKKQSPNDLKFRYYWNPRDGRKVFADSFRLAGYWRKAR